MRGSQNRQPAEQERWPETPGELVYRLDRVLDLFNRMHNGTRIDLLEELLNVVDWREMFGSNGTGVLTSKDIHELKRFYRSRFQQLDRYYLAEQLSTQLMSALMVSGDIAFSKELTELGRNNPDLWNEIRTFFSRKELATTTAMLADHLSEP